jgi:EmrB/QacA subfamily drug resistance transporter
MKRHSLLLAVCCTAQFMVILDVSIVNVALPSIRASLGFSATELQWIVNAYTITFAGFLMLGGRAADLVGQRAVFSAGLLLFALASLAGGVAVSREMLIGARAAQGLGGAIMAPASLSIINSSFAAGAERHRAVGLWGSMNGAGGAAGVLLGGVITQALTWRWILLINIPIAIVVIAIAQVAVPERAPKSADSSAFDLGGALTVTGGLLALVYGIVSAGDHGWGSLQALGPIGIGIVLLASFLLVEGRLARVPLVPLRIFASAPLRVSNGVVLLFSAALFPMWYFVSLYLQEVLHMTPIGAGLAFLPMALTIMTCATRAGALVARVGAGRVMGVGLTLMAIGMALFARISADGGYITDVMVPGLLVAMGIGFTVVPSTIVATSGVAPQEAGLASGLINTSRQMGGALGLAILATVATEYTSHLVNSDYRAPMLALTDGFRLAFALGGAFCVVGALASFLLLPRVRPGAPGVASERPGPVAAPATAAAPVASAPAAAPDLPAAAAAEASQAAIVEGAG